MNPQPTTVNSTSYDPSLLTPKQLIPPEYLTSINERLRYEWVSYHRNKATVVDNLHYQEGESWIFQEELLDIVKVLSFALRYNLSNKGVEEMVTTMKELSPGNDRLISMPSTWRTMTKRAMEGFDPSCYERYSFPVPPHLGLDITEVPFILKKFPAVLDSLLLDRDDMQHGNFWFGDPKGKTCKGSRSGTAMNTVPPNLKPMPPHGGGWGGFGVSPTSPMQIHAKSSLSAIWHDLT